MRITPLVVVLLWVPTAFPAEPVVPAASLRFEASANGEIPDFQQHVVPLLGRLGCNGRACHGSFQGRGGMRLSLFGYDFKMDHDAITDQATSEDGLRIDLGTAGQSLILRKPLLDTDHEGGKRFESESWQHHLLQRWIAAGAKGVASPRELARLECLPPEIVFESDPKPVELRVIAHWQDGTREDVTPLCRFRSNDDSIVTVDDDGRLRSSGRGDTHVIAFYDNGVSAVAVMRAKPVPTGVDGDPSPEPATKIDQFVEAKLDKLGIVPSPLCTDAEFLRRVSIDVTGTLPTPEEVEQFLADQSEEKRRRKVNELLERPSYAAWWANKLCDFTGCNPSQQAELGQETAVQWYMWIYRRVHENLRYDELVRQIVLAKGRQRGQSYDDYAREVTESYKDESFQQFASRETMPHYWSRRTLEKPDDKGLAFAHNFLGIRLQCAQCHKHPFAPWTQHDFQQFSSFFENVKYGVQADADKRYRDLAKQVGLNLRGDNGTPVRKDVLTRAPAGRTIPWREVYIDQRDSAASLSLLRSGTVDLQVDQDPREAIMQWMNEPGNPWFASALVNRVWAGYFHVGIVDPPDDINPANPPSHPQLLRWLADEFVRHDYDMKWLHREIVSSDAYGRSWKPNATNGDDRRNFSRAVPRRIPAEVVYDGLKQALAASDQLSQVRSDLSRRAIGHLSMQLAGTYAMHVFGKPERAVNCDCERVNQPTLLQSVFLQNDPLVEQRLSESGWIAEIAESEAGGHGLDQAAFIRTAWLRTLGRPPTIGEIERAQKHLAEVESVSEGVRDLMWALINTKEFILNR